MIVTKDGRAWRESADRDCAVRKYRMRGARGGSATECAAAPGQSRASAARPNRTACRVPLATRPAPDHWLERKVILRSPRTTFANWLNALAVISVQTINIASHADSDDTACRLAVSRSSVPSTYWCIMRDVQSVPDTCRNMFDMSIQELNGKGPKKRKKSLEQICDNEGNRSELNEDAKKEGESSSAKNGAGPKVEGVELLHWRDMPQHLQFNPYVLTGYRPLQSWSGCVRSLFYFHNETINILTHGKSKLIQV